MTYTQETEDDVFEVIEQAVLACAPTPSANLISSQTDISVGLVQRAIARLALTGRITIEKANGRNIFSIPGENGATVPVAGAGGACGRIDGPFDYVRANERMVAALGAYFRKHHGAPA